MGGEQGGVGGRPDQRHGDGVGHLADEGPQGDHGFDVHIGEHLGHQAGVGLPAQVGLVAGDHHQVVGLLGQFDGVEAGRRPGEAPGAALGHLHHGAVHLEVVELLGFDDHEGLQFELAEEVGQRPGGGVAGVVPAFPGEQGPGTAQGGPAEAADRVHARAG